MVILVGPSLSCAHELKFSLLLIVEFLYPPPPNVGTPIPTHDGPSRRISLHWNGRHYSSICHKHIHTHKQFSDDDYDWVDILCPRCSSSFTFFYCSVGDVTLFFCYFVELRSFYSLPRIVHRLITQEQKHFLPRIHLLMISFLIPNPQSIGISTAHPFEWI